MIVQALIFLYRAKRVQMKEDGEIYIDDSSKKLVTACEEGGPCVGRSIHKSSDELVPLLEYLEGQNLLEIQGPCYFRLKYDGYHYFQAIISSVLHFLLTSVFIPIVVAFITTLVSLWLTGVFK